MSDPGAEDVEKLLKKLEARLTKEYSEATKEMRKKVDDYFRRFQIKDAIKRQAVIDGKITQADYIAWRQGQMMAGERWQAMLQTLAEDATMCNMKARSIVYGFEPDAYATNFNYGTFCVEASSGVDTSFTLYSRETVERLVRDDPKLLPDPRPNGKLAQMLAENKDMRWNMQKLNSAILQGVIQGESIPKIAKRVETVGQMNHKQAIRAARTAMTGAQNAGRVDAAKRAEEMGIGTVLVWTATIDMRTRYDHRQADGQRHRPGEAFDVGGYKLKFPGDPEAPAEQVCNCRCTLIPQNAKHQYAVHTERTDLSQIEGMTYDEWRESHVEKPNRITLPEEKAAAIKGAYIKQYKDLKK